MKAATLFDESAREAVRAAVARFEATTSAEVVCAVADESGRYDRAESIAGLCVGIAAWIVARLATQWFLANGDWAISDWSLTWEIPVLIAGFVGGSWLASQWWGLRRLLVGEREMATDCERNANWIQSRVTLGAAGRQCGLLIYLSLFEHRVVLLPDREVHEVLGQERIEELCRIAVAEITEGRIRNVFALLMDEIQPELSTKLPANRTLDESEVDDHLWIVNRA